MNLEWVVRPVIQKPKSKQAENEDSDGTKIKAMEEDTVDNENSLAHVYFKDLSDLLALPADNELTVLCDPAKILNIKDERKPHTRNFDQASAKTVRDARDARRQERHKIVVERFENDACCRLLHLRVASLFANQLTAQTKIS